MRLEIGTLPDVLVEVEPLIAQPYDVAAWRGRIVEAALGATPARSTPAATDCGWPMELVEADGVVVALYAFVDHVAAAVARGGRRDEVVALLRAARPDWSGPDIACLTELWKP